MPTDALRRHDADIVMLALSSNSVMFLNPVDDLVFSAHRPLRYTDISTGENVTVYTADDVISVISCTEQVNRGPTHLLCFSERAHRAQYQFCIAQPSKPFCTNLSSLPSDVTPRIFPGASNIQIAALQLLRNSSVTMDISNANVQLLSVNKLVNARDSIVSLPIDHWVKELQNLEKFVFASLQIAITDYALGLRSEIL
jgi:hypothetical protein